MSPHFMDEAWTSFEEPSGEFVQGDNQASPDGQEEQQANAAVEPPMVVLEIPDPFDDSFHG
jgi:hypothetical protein